MVIDWIEHSLLCEAGFGGCSTRAALLSSHIFLIIYNLELFCWTSAPNQRFINFVFQEHESEGGRTPLMKAARAGHLCTVQFLISKGKWLTLCSEQPCEIKSFFWKPLFESMRGNGKHISYTWSSFVSSSLVQVLMWTELLPTMITQWCLWPALEDIWLWWSCCWHMAQILHTDSK